MNTENPEGILTLEWLEAIRRRFIINGETPKIMVGIIMNPSVLSAIKSETIRGSATDECLLHQDYFSGTAIYISNEVDKESTEVWYDKYLLEKRLETLGIK